MVSASWRAILQDRIERRHRVLEHHGDAVAAHLAQLLGGHRRRRRGPGTGSAPPTMRAGSSSSRISDKRGDALARAGFADDAERLAGGDREADAIDGAHDAFIGEELRAQVAHLEESAWRLLSRRPVDRSTSCTAMPSPPPRLGVEPVADAVAEEIEAEHDRSGWRGRGRPRPTIARSIRGLPTPSSPIPASAARRRGRGRRGRRR